MEGDNSSMEEFDIRFKKADYSLNSINKKNAKLKIFCSCSYYTSFLISILLGS